VSPLRRQLGHLKRFPDAHLGWAPHAIAAGARLQHDVLYSSSGPFTSHLVGLALQRITRKPWVAELRDGWYRWNRAIFPDYPAWRGPLERRFEAAVIRNAQRVVLVSERMADAFRCQYSDLPRDHFGVVSNGFDPAQFTASSTAATQAGFNVVHAGALYYGRSLSTFLQAAARVVDTDPQFASTFRLTLLGSLDAAALAELARHPLADRVTYRGYVDHAASLAAMRGADLLLLIANTTAGAEATVPGKLFEYLAVGRPILAIAPSANSSTGDVLAQTRGGRLAEADNPEQIECALREAFAGRVPPPDPAQVARFDRRSLAGQLGGIFDDVRATHRV
jgi:glycosyltransferase involved in cell wall biosynthesis